MYSRTEQINILRTMGARLATTEEGNKHEKGEGFINSAVLDQNYRYQTICNSHGYTQTYIYVYICIHRQVCICAHTCTSQLCLLRGSRSNDTPVAISTPSIYILVFKYHSEKNKKIKRNKASRLLGEMYGFRAGAGKIQDKS